MPLSQPDFRHTWLWKHVFVNPRGDSSIEEQEFFRDEFLRMRENVALLVSRIAHDIPGLTVHDITHLDALWEMASVVAEGAMTLSPPEAFVFGASVLLHDSAMCLAAYPRGIADLRETTVWKDVAARWLQGQNELSKDQRVTASQPSSLDDAVLPEVLRRLHAEQAAALAQQAWSDHTGEQRFLIADSDVRHFYGQTVGEIARSHWWTVQQIEEHLSQDIGAFAQRTRNKVDRLKIACLLRIADALHLDSRRAPRFLRVLAQPRGTSALHWTFQEKLAQPHVEGDAIVFTTGMPFRRNEAEAWWLAFDTLSMVDRELAEVDQLLQSRASEGLKARRVKGIGSPELLARTVVAQGWRPVDARVKATDVPRIVETLGGAKLYGRDPIVPLRELIQNAADAIQARRRLQSRSDNWGEVRISIEVREGKKWLIVEDNGIGMSELVLTGPLLDFGTSFWRSPLVMDEFPGLIASGMEAIGRFGIGFFSVFMLGHTVRVISRRFDKSSDSARVVEISGGPGGRPILWPADASTPVPLDGGSRVEVLLNTDPSVEGGFLCSRGYTKEPMSLPKAVASIAPGLDANIVCRTAEGDAEVDDEVVKASDWLTIPSDGLLMRLSPGLTNSGKASSAMRKLVSPSGDVFGRAAIWPVSAWEVSYGGWVTVRGIRACPVVNLQGVLVGETVTASRNDAIPLVPKEVLVEWATEQASLLCEARLDEHTKARMAEIVLECGGEVGELPILCRGDEWCSARAFRHLIAESSELVVHFGGEFSYDGDEDEMHPREFASDFELSPTLFMVQRHNGSILRNTGWPGSLFLGRGGGNRLEALVRQLVAEAWDGTVADFTERRTVGTAAGYAITRVVTVFMRVDVGSPSASSETEDA